MKEMNLYHLDREAPLPSEAEVLSATNLARYESLIDPTEFNVLRGYLRSQTSPIDYLLHVKDRSMLAPLAARLDQALKTAQPLEPIIYPLANEGVLRVSSRHLLMPDLFSAFVNPNRVPQQAQSEVIYLPPFYLAHTPDLFAMKPHSVLSYKFSQEQSQVTAPTEPVRQNPRRRREHEMSH